MSAPQLVAAIVCAHAFVALGAALGACVLINNGKRGWGWVLVAACVIAVPIELI